MESFFITSSLTLSETSSIILVLVNPGDIELTLILNLANSFDNTCVKAIKDNLLEA